MKERIIPYNPKLKKVARMLRKNMTLSEVLLWQQIKGKQRLGYDFDRQRPIDNYIVDFFCKELRLAIEIDGDSHHTFSAQKNDKIRQTKLEKLGVKFLRFDDLDIKTNLDWVIEEIDIWIQKNAHNTEIPI